MENRIVSPDYREPDIHQQGIAGVCLQGEYGLRKRVLLRQKACPNRSGFFLRLGVGHPDLCARPQPSGAGSPPSLPIPELFPCQPGRLMRKVKYGGLASQDGISIKRPAVTL